MDNLIPLALGIIIGAVACFALQRWFAQRAAVHEKTTSIQAPGHGLLVPVFGAEYPENAIQLGLALAQKMHKSLHIVAYIEVPRTQSLESDHAGEVVAACDRLDQARQQGARAGVKVWVSAMKVRSYTSGIIETAHEIDAGLIIFAQPHAWTTPNGPAYATQADLIREKGGCAVLLTPAPVTGKGTQHADSFTRQAGSKELSGEHLNGTGIELERQTSIAASRVVR